MVDAGVEFYYDKAIFINRENRRLAVGIKKARTLGRAEQFIRDRVLCESRRGQSAEFSYDQVDGF